MRKTVATIIIVAIFVIADWMGFVLSGNEAKFNDVQRLHEAIPAYPGAKQVDSSWSSKPFRVHVGQTYESDASYDDLKHYYMDQLQHLGWQFVEEKQTENWWRDLGGRKLTFRRGEFYMSIEYAGEKADYGWNYATSVRWPD